MKDSQFALKLNYALGLLRPATIEMVITDGQVITQKTQLKPTEEQIEACKNILLELCKEAENRGWAINEEDLWKDSPEDYEFDWQFRNNQ